MTHPSRPIPPAAEDVQRFGERLMTAQRGIRILNAIRWDDGIEQSFLASGGREPPPVSKATYDSNLLGFEPGAKDAELADLARSVRNRFGAREPVARMLLGRIESCRGTIAMLVGRGTRKFSQYSARLYDSPTREELRSVPRILEQIATRLQSPGAEKPAIHHSESAATRLESRLRRSMGRPVPVHVSGRLTADAAAGPNCIRLRRGALFSTRDIEMLEAHEGWCHLGTTRNGRQQHALRFLAKSSPMTTGMQEGLAVACEILSGTAGAERIRQIADRFHAVRIATDGADFLEIYRSLIERGQSPQESYRAASRVFRGSLPVDGGPFAKDASYALGLVRLVRIFDNLFRDERFDQVGWLACGKLSFQDLSMFLDGVGPSLGVSPEFVPPPLRDPNRLRRSIDAILNEHAAVYSRGRSAVPLAHRLANSLSFSKQPTSRSA